MKLFATAKQVREDTSQRANHGQYWSKSHVELAKKMIRENYHAWNIAVNLERQLSGLCIKMEKEGVLKAVYNSDECGSDYYYTVPPNNPCSEIELPTTKEKEMIVKNQTVVLDEIIEDAHPERLLVLLTKVEQKHTEYKAFKADNNAYIKKQLTSLLDAKKAILAELEKRA